MTNNIKCTLAFTVGAAIGAAITWGYLKTKYEQFAQREIEDVKEYYRNKRQSRTNYSNEEADIEIEKAQYEAFASEYSSDSSSVKVEDDKDPYVITPEELGDIDDYDTTTLWYYADGVLVDLDDEIVEDVVGTVGKDFESHFGEYEDDSVCVRNDTHKCDYEILRDSRRYSDVKRPARPHEAEE